MECIQPAASIANCLGTPVCKYLQYHRKLNDYVRNFKRIRDELSSKMEDIELQLKAELLHCVGKIPKKEVENWIGKVKVMIMEAQDVENKVSNGRYLCRACNGKLVDRKIQEMQTFLDKAPNVSDSLVIDGPNVGLPLPTSELVGEKAVRDEIWQCLMQEEVGKIGVWGMGGVGKTTIMKHIHNDLLKEHSFERVIWVTISKDFSVMKLQDDIASALKLKGDWGNERDKVSRAAILLELLKKVGKHVLILDDVWDKVSLEEVGIPEPSSSSGCKLVLTTRSEQVFVVLAGTMKGEDDPCIWKNALKELKERVGMVEGVEAEVIERLKFSFDHLKDEKLKHCFLYCALYPENFPIWEDELIECWIDERFIDEMNTRQEMKGKGHAILKKLEDNCLLENGTNQYDQPCKKMHDAVRDMALSITSINPRYMIQAGLQLEKLPKEEDWIRDIEKVSLRNNSISEIPIDMSPPKCQLLTTLLQGRNPIKKIPNSFFMNMPFLSVLDLSFTNIECLPDSISELKNLTALLLEGCEELRALPCLSKLQRLKKLDLNYTSIEKVPEGMDILINLRYLNLFVYTLKVIPTRVLPKLSHLQHLKVYMHDETKGLKADEVVPLQKLECFYGRFENRHELNKFVSSMQQCKKNLKKYQLYVGLFSLVGSEERVVSINDLEIGGGELMFPVDMQELSISYCQYLRHVSHISSLKNVVDLRVCKIGHCEGIECVVSFSSFSSSTHQFQSLQCLFLVDLPKLSEVIKVEGYGSATTSILASSATFSNLKDIHILDCPSIMTLLPHWLLPNLQNLEEISVRDCEKLVEIFAAEDEEKGSDALIKFDLPKLKFLNLESLPELKSICSKSGVMVCDSLQLIDVDKCDKLKRIPPFVSFVGNGQSYAHAPPSLKINSSRQWWESLEWDDPNFKNVLQPLWQDKQFLMERALHKIKELLNMKYPRFL
ncbi:hypothetical protein PVK06_018103 [Gossypium arboreum]|uniref:AAA+ ATPase domain-containing protein n=1 Tax=Gossypium arboreum TaxID=29729 RepID=A0ABR0Q5G2_GOSAR|nr:hypothetical protein PVK06_018103 [Gossypium arboreum]